MTESESLQPNSRPRLFLSYGRRDAAELAKRLRADLEKLGYEVWQDIPEIRAGKEWEDQIVDGLRSTQVVIAVLTPHSIRRATDKDSPDGMDSVCIDEWYYTRRVMKKPLVPLLAEPCLEIPFVVCALDYVEMLRWSESGEVYRRGFERLLEAITAELNREPNEPQPPLNPNRWYHRLPILDFAAQLHEKRQDFVGRQWLFDAIDAWRAGSSKERALLIVGDPGIGKSAFVAEMIHRNPGGQVLAFHICRADDPETLRPSTFVMSLAGMIAGRLPAFADLLEARQFQELFDPNTLFGRPAHVFDQGLIAGLHKLPAPPDGIRYLLIDALDEALTLGEDQLNIVKLVSTRLEQFPAWLRIVATTRREPEVLNKLSGLRAASIDAHRQDNLDDIDRFIEVRLQTPDLAERLVANRASLSTVQQKLRAKADGNFLYVSQALQDIERDNYSFNRLDELPQGLNQWYEAWFTRKFPNPKVDFVDACKLLEVILAACEPLAIANLSLASGLDAEYKLPSVIRQLVNFLAVRDEKYALFHKSIVDWLAGNSAKSAYHVSENRGQERMADMCWSEYLIQPTGMSDYSERYIKFHLLAVSRFDNIRELLERYISEKSPPYGVTYFNDWGSSSFYEDARNELQDILFKLGKHRRWHPRLPKEDRFYDAHDDYVSEFVFPCCGTKVLGTKNPSQYRSDGCEEASRSV